MGNDESGEEMSGRAGLVTWGFSTSRQSGAMGVKNRTLEHLHIVGPLMS